MRLKIWRQLGAASLAGSFEQQMTLLYRSEAPRLRRRLARSVSPDRASDLVQSAFLRLLGLGDDRVARVDRPQAYLNRIADNLVNDEAKFAVRRSEHLHVDIAENDVAAADTLAALEARDLLRRVEAAIALLPDRTREIFMAHRFEDLTYGAIADSMGVSVKTVEKHLSVALRELHRLLSPPTP